MTRPLAFIGQTATDAAENAAIARFLLERERRAQLGWTRRVVGVLGVVVGVLLALFVGVRV